MLSFGSLRHFCKITASLKILASNASTSATSEQHLRLPAGYRKTPPFGLFVKEQFEKRDGKKVTFVQLKEEWKSLDEVVKKKYKEQSEARGKEKRANFAALDLETQRQLCEENEKRREERQLRRARRVKAAMREASGRPPRPLSAYNYFVKEKMLPLGLKNGNPRDVAKALKEVANSWKLLSDKEKQKYVDEAKASAKLYEKEMQRWKDAKKGESTSA